MSPYEAIEAFEKQTKRATSLKTVIMPSAVADPGPIVEISFKKLTTDLATLAGRRNLNHAVRLTVRVKATIESLTGLKAAIDADKALSDFLASASRLETLDAEQNPVSVASSRITMTTSEDDTVLEEPETGKKVWLDDPHIVTIYLPPE